MFSIHKPVYSLTLLSNCRPRVKDSLLLFIMAVNTNTQPLLFPISLLQFANLHQSVFTPRRNFFVARKKFATPEVSPREKYDPTALSQITCTLY